MKKIVKLVGITFLLVGICLIGTQVAMAQRFYRGGAYFHSSYYSPGYRYYAPRTSVSVHIGAPFYSRPYIPYGPTIGLRFSVLPFGYYPFYWGNSMYYFYDNVFYRRYDDRNYEVVAPPMGAKVPNLPRGAKSVIIDGQTYYELGGTYYLPTYNNQNQLLYEVVGVNGVLNQSGMQQPLPPQQQQPPMQQPPIYHDPSVGDLVMQLPPQCKTVNLGGQQYYVSPNGIYYQQVMDGNRAMYKVVSK